MKRFSKLSILSTLMVVIGSTSLVAQFQDNRPYIDQWRPNDKRGVNLFETPKLAPADFNGLQVRFGGAFAQQFQMLVHDNDALDNDPGDANELIDLGNNFNNETAILIMDAQLAKGVRMKLDTYLSSRHHVEAWVKGGFIQFDALPFFGSPVIDDIMQYVTVKIGHMEINYGDMHFRRTDNAQAMYNPFVGNLIMDAFTTEIGGEVYFQKDGFLGMVGITNGEIRGDVTNPDNKAPSYLFKAGYDKPLNDDLRVRLTGSFYTTSKSANNTLFFGDRAGSRYFFVMEPVGASAAAQA